MPGLNFSFSGLKTAILYDLVRRNAYDMHTKILLNKELALKEQVASSLLVCIGDIFVQKLAKALEQYPVNAVTFVGGVACNKYLRHQIATLCTTKELPFFVPSPHYCTDNGAMIAFVGHYKAQQGLWSPMTLDIR